MYNVIPPDNKNTLIEDTRRDHHGHDGYDAAERLKDAMASSLAQVLNQIGNTVVAVEKVSAAGQLATEKVGAANQLATERTAAAVASANASNFANTQNILIGGFKDGRFDSATATAQILSGQVVGFKDGRYDAAVNFAAMQKDMAECCCELKGLITSDGESTRQLVQAIDGRRSDRELVDSKNEVTLLKLQLAASGNGNGRS